jgi:hypothetical protein
MSQSVFQPRPGPQNHRDDIRSFEAGVEIISPGDLASRPAGLRRLADNSPNRLGPMNGKIMKMDMALIKDARTVHGGEEDGNEAMGTTAEEYGFHRGVWII